MDTRKLLAIATFAFAAYSFVRAFQKLKREFSEARSVET